MQATVCVVYLCHYPYFYRTQVCVGVFLKFFCMYKYFLHASGERKAGFLWKSFYSNWSKIDEKSKNV